MKTITFAQSCYKDLLWKLGLSMFFVLTLSINVGYSQCVPIPNSISGTVFLDEDFDGVKSATEVGQSNVSVTAYDAEGMVAGGAVTDVNGYYQIEDLTEGIRYQVIFDHNTGLVNGFVGNDNGSSVQYQEAPNCETSFALSPNLESCGQNPEILLTCFVQGEVTANPTAETLVKLDHNFDPNTKATKVAMHGETGSIWGVAWKDITQEVFSSAFIKLNAGLKDGPYAIYKTDMSGDDPVTTKFTDVNDLLNGKLFGLGENTDIAKCDYGNSVGRVGLGNMIMSPDQTRLFVSVLDDNTIVSFSNSDPQASTTDTYEVPKPTYLEEGKEWKIFALAWKGNKIYIGITVTAAESKNPDDSRFVIMTLDPSTGVYEEIFQTDHVLGFWQDDIPDSYSHSHWLTDIAFTDDNNMLLGVSDRVGHRYCKPASGNRVDQQYPDLLGVWFDESDGTWKLEENGTLGTLTGSGVDNGDGPGGGEFFGNDFWPTDPDYHNETALGSILTVPGTGSVVAAVYDPLTSSYSAGLHRYNTTNGDLLGATQLYTQDIDNLFGKATGFGNIISLCNPGSIEIGNYVWFDANADGSQNSDEDGLGNIPLNLYSSDCTLLGSTVTDATGHYVFNIGNVPVGVYPNSTYYVEIDNSVFNEETGLYVLNGDEFAICSSPNSTADIMDCDAVSSGNSCFAGGYIEVQTEATNHNFDLGFAVPNEFDLALTKQIIGSKFIRKGDLVSFNIRVENQGGYSAGEVEVVDYVPNGFTFDEADNLGWSLVDGKVKTKFTDVLAPGADVSRIIRLRAVASHGASHVNYAEISNTLNISGKPIFDGDSVADDIDGNDAGGVPGSSADDFLDGDGTEDEDDHDPAVPYIFDLAIKVVLSEEKEYLPGDIVKFDITVYNQGNVTADKFDVTQYAQEGLLFEAAMSEGWSLIEGKPTMKTDTDLEVGEQRDYCIYYRLGEEVTEESLASYSEISMSIPVGSTEVFDFDSTPDALDDNDLGAEAYTTTDNFLAGSGAVDEDDHDIVIVTSRFADLALVKTVDQSLVKPGQEVTFQIEIHNQGTQPVDQVKIVDYLPEGMLLQDEDWYSLTADRAEILLTLDEPIHINGKVTTSITTYIDEGVTANELINYAEISAMYYEGVDLSDKDRDSTPDDTNTNDNGGQAGTDTDDALDLVVAIDEDDHDPARVVLIQSRLVSSTCLGDAVSNPPGYFADTYEITGPSDDTWTVNFVQGYIGEGGPISIGDEIDETDQLPGGLSTYVFTVFREDGVAGRIDLINTQDEIESFTQGPEYYEPILVTGETALCGGGEETYNVIDPVPGLTYTWSLPGEGAIVGSTTGTSVTVDWSGAAAPGFHDLMVSADGCYKPGTITIANGAASGAMFCLGSINVSLGPDCELTVNADLVLAGGMPDGAAFSVMLLNANNEVIPSATLNASHIGQTITAKVIDGCSGNSCWSTIFVEDKIKPSIICQDAELACNQVDEYVGPAVTDNCGGEVVLTMTQNIYTAFPDCDPDFLGEYDRSYFATDEQGNVSDVCNVKVKVKRSDLDEVLFPADTTVNCLGYPTDEDGFPSVEVTGKPEYNNDYIFPQNDPSLACGLVATYEDMRVPTEGTLGGVVKVMRTWTVYEWCSDPLYVQKTQVIKIQDTTPPVITSCPDDVTVSAVGGDCEATVTVPLPLAMDECSDFTIITNYPGGVINGNDSRVVTFAYSTTPYEITYTVTDDAGYTVTCSSTITVVDDIAPIAICDGNTVVSLNSNGQAYLYAGALDDGSYDACGIDSMAVRRMDAAGVCGNANDVLADRVFFCCEDVGQTNMVQFVVWDQAGNSNACMVNVQIQDKQAPVITTLPNVTIDCADDLYPLSQFGTPTFNDACEVTLSIDSTVNINTCGLGTVLRTFTASDANGSSTSTQLITVVNSTPFGSVDSNNDGVPDDITFLPADYDAIGICGMDLLHPDSLPQGFGRPEFTYDDCSLVGAAYDDEVYPFSDVDNTCAKIVRTWYITDWCQEDDPNYEEFTHVQIIKVINTVDPTITTTDIPTATTLDCNEGFISMSATGEDDCTPAAELMWTAQLDFDQDGVATQDFDITLSGMGNTAIAEGTFPVGTHYVQWTFKDACGNNAVSLQEFVIASQTPPVLACVDFTVGLGPMDLEPPFGEFDTEMACFNVDTLLSVVPSGSIYHPCGTPFELSLQADNIVKKDTFDCSDLGINVLTVYAIDEFGNVTSCVLEIDVQDNNDVDVCLDVKACTEIPLNGDLEIGSNCVATVADTSFDPTQISTECSPLTYTHNYLFSPSNTTLQGTQFPTGTFVITWTITDGNMTETCDIVIEVADDTDPTLNCIMSMTYGDSDDQSEDCQHTMASTNLDPFASDCALESLTHDYTSAPSNTTLMGAVFPLGTTTITWTAEDEEGNSTECTMTVVVTDDVAPGISCAPDASYDDTDDGNNGCNHTADASLDATADDNCPGNVTITHNYGPAPSNTTLAGAVFPLGTTTVTWTATDVAGNSNTCTTTITVVDNVNPTISCGADLVVNDTADGDLSCDHTITGMAQDPTANDNCSVASITHDYTAAPSATTLNGATFPQGETTVIWTVTDGAGLTATCEVTIEVNDEEAPECVAQDDISVSIDNSGVYTFSINDLSNPLTDNCDPNPVYEFIPATINCDDVGETVTIGFTATDNSNNESSMCTFQVTVMEAGEPECNPIDITVSLDANGEVTIEPSDVNNIGMSACGITPDVTIDPSMFDCGDIGDNTVTITVTDGTETTTCTATVTVNDDVVGPTIECADDITATDADDGDLSCTHTIAGAEANATGMDNCNVASLVHDYTSAPSNTTLAGAVFNLGTTPVIWTVTDDAGNVNTCTVNITVTDETAPACVEQDTAFITIDTGGSYDITTADLSTLLVDNCDNTNLVYSFNPAMVDCDNVGDTITVGFSAIDMSMNESPGCPLVIVVMEGGEPECNPIDITINLDAIGQASITADDVNDIGMTACGNVPDVTLSKDMFFCNDVGDNEVTITVTDGNTTVTCVAIVTVTDTIFGPTVICEDDQAMDCTTFEAMYGVDVRAWMDDTPGIQGINDNCPENAESMYTMDTVYVINPNECGFGVSTRTFIVEDVNGVSSQCTQTFTVNPPTDPITQDDIDGLALPDTILITDCTMIDLLPNEVNGQITTDSLDQLGMCFRDSISFVDVNINPGSTNMCNDTLIRTWTVIDSCQLDATDPSAGIFDYTQVIIVNDNTAPVVEGIMDYEAIVDPVTCIAVVTFDGISASDCNDITASNDSEFADDPNSVNPAGEYMVGEYEIIITATDACGNSGMDTINLSVIDTAEFVITCQKLFPNIDDDVTLTVTTMPEDYVIIEGNCDEEQNLTFSFSETDMNDTIRVWDCDDVNTMVEERVYWFDENGDLVDSCRIQTTPTDLDSLCDMNGLVFVGGGITNPAGEGLSSFEVTLEGSPLMNMSDEEGKYLFPSMPMGGEYEIVPAKDGDDKDGVNTIDLVKIQRHMLQLDVLDSPYKMIAADINNDERITGADLLALRKLLLGIHDEFTNNTSWRTVDGDYIFPDPQDPWAEKFPETYDIEQLNSNMLIDFIGVKIGNVDESSNVTGNVKSQTRSQTQTTFELEQSESANALTAVTLIPTVDEIVYGMQLGLSIEDSEISEITSDVFAASDIDFYETSAGNYNVIITAPHGVEISSEEAILTFHLYGDDLYDLGNQVTINDKQLASELYIGSDMTVSNVNLDVRSDEEPATSITSLAVEQNRPNPWTDNTTITFSIPERDVVAVAIYDVNGRLVHNARSSYEAGTHEVQISNDILTQTGVYYYHVSYKADRQQYKMIKVD